MSAPRVRLRIDFDEHTSLGPGKIELLEAIAASARCPKPPAGCG